MRRSVSAAMGLLLAATLAAVRGASPNGGAPATGQTPSVPAQPLQPVPDPERKAVPVASPDSAWAAPGVSAVDLRGEGGRAGESPISIRSVDGGPGGVRVEVFDRSVADRLGVVGVLVGVTRTDGGAATAPVRTPIGVSWQLNDRQASAELSVDATTGTVSQRRYLPYGGDRSTQAWWPTDRGFHDKTADSSTGLVHLGAREYDPDTGQFLSVDPLVGQTGTPYSYAANDPVTYSDPTGLAYEECTSGQYVCRGGTQVIRKGKSYAKHMAKHARDNKVYARNYKRYKRAQWLRDYCPCQCEKARAERARSIGGHTGSANAADETERRRQIEAYADDPAAQLAAQAGGKSDPPKRNKHAFDFSEGWTAHVCGGYGVAVVAATGNDGCFVFDKRGGGWSTTNIEGIETGIGVDALFGVGFSNAPDIETLAGEGYYGGVTGGEGVIVSGQMSTNTDRTYLSRTLGVGLGASIPALSFSGGKSNTLVQRLWTWPSSPKWTEDNHPRRHGR